MLSVTESDSLARWLSSDRETSRGEIKAGVYPHADRTYELYSHMIPILDPLLEGMTKDGRTARGLDIGCGTGRAAAELMRRYPKVDMKGITLIFHPPIASHEALPKERIRICHAGNTGYPDHSFDLLLAVGSLDTSNTIFTEGRHVLKLVDRGGLFIFAPIVWCNKEMKEMDALVEYALAQGFSVNGDVNCFNTPVFIFENNGE